MAGYLIANIEVTDAAKFQEYREKVTPLIEKFGGRYIVRGGDLRRLDCRCSDWWFRSFQRSRPPNASMTAPSISQFSSCGSIARDRTWCLLRVIDDGQLQAAPPVTASRVRNERQALTERSDQSWCDLTNVRASACVGTSSLSFSWSSDVRFASGTDIETLPRDGLYPQKRTRQRRYPTAPRARQMNVRLMVASLGADKKGTTRARSHCTFARVPKQNQTNHRSADFKTAQDI